jgi:hypothetical protein
LLDNKRPQEIQLLSAETNLRPDPPPTPLPPDTFTNRLFEHASGPDQRYSHSPHLEQNNGLWTGTLQTVFLQLNSRGEIIHVLDDGSS